MGWTALLGPGLGVVLLSTISAIGVAVIGKKQAVETTLPEHFTRELERMTARQDVMQRRIDRLERLTVRQSDHIDALERWIADGKGPPPPPRPDFRIGDDDATAG